MRLTVAGTGESCGPWIECRRPGESVPKARKEFQRKHGMLILRPNISTYSIQMSKIVLPSGRCEIENRYIGRGSGAERRDTIMGLGGGRSGRADHLLHGIGVLEDLAFGAACHQELEGDLCRVHLQITGRMERQRDVCLDLEGHQKLSNRFETALGMCSTAKIPVAGPMRDNRLMEDSAHHLTSSNSRSSGSRHNSTTRLGGHGRRRHPVSSATAESRRSRKRR